MHIDELFSINHDDELERIDYMLEHEQLTEPNYNYAVHSGIDWFIRVCEPYAKKYPQNYALYTILIEAMISMRYFDKAEEYIKLMQCSEDKKHMPQIFFGDIEAAKGNLENAKQIWNTIPSQVNTKQANVLTE